MGAVIAALSIWTGIPWKTLVSVVIILMLWDFLMSAEKILDKYREDIKGIKRAYFPALDE